MDWRATGAAQWLRPLLLWLLVLWPGLVGAQPANPAPTTAPAAVPPVRPKAPPVAAAPSKESKAAPTPKGPAELPPDLVRAKGRIVVLPLRQEVSLGMASFVERVVEEVREDDILIVDVNTLGGRVDAAIRIRDALLAVEQRGGHVIAYLNPRAISAGALISFAADVIVVGRGSTMGAATPVQIGSDQKMKPVSEKIVSYMRQEMRSTAVAKGHDGDVAEAMVDADLEVPGLSLKGKLLTLDGATALEWGIASFQANSIEDLVNTIGGLPYAEREVVAHKWSWAEEIAAWLSGSAISGLLMTLGMLGLMVGLYTGGNPLPMALGAVALCLFFFGHHVVNLAGIEDMVVFALGLALIAAEFVAGGHGLLAAAGLACVVGSLFMGLVNFGGVNWDIQWEFGYINSALRTVFGAVIATGILMAIAGKFLPKSRLGKRFILASGIDVTATDELEVATKEAQLVGAIGLVTAKLRPSGKVKVLGRRYDARSDLGMIEVGEKVVVTARKGYQLVVRPLEADEC